ncbi:LSU ribosomal protein L44E4 [Enterospora canceri]|uniref:LSU ribosomal protein L44E4 n=1 Tax=Enterospora canceri TaxID=1081671 RepID=A0A1Y1S9H1_9MICR|nr:LSU ribosomal protein L44E4 [Enterospora canceri]
MIAEPILFIPTIFTDVHKTNLEIFEEYITIIDKKKGSADNKNIRSHTFKMLKPLLDEYPELRDGVNDLYELSDYFEFIERIKGMNVDKKVLELRPNLRKCYFEHKE